MRRLGSSEVQILDEVSKYNIASMGCVSKGRNKFIQDDFSVMRFWYDRRAQYLFLYAVAARIYATPVSSSSSERLFSALKLLVEEKRSRLSNYVVDDMILVSSLYA